MAENNTTFLLEDYVFEETDNLEIFGFPLKKKSDKKVDKKEEIKSFVEPSTDDGSAIFVSSGTHQLGFYNLGDYSAKSDINRIKKYREIASYPEVEQAIDEIVNELIVMDDEYKSVELSLDDVELPEKVKNQIVEEFNDILSLLSFSTNGYDIAKKWYEDGRLVYHMILNEKNDDIAEIRPIDPVHIKKIKEVEETIDPTTKAKLYKTKQEYFLYVEDAQSSSSSSLTTTGLKIHKDAIVYVTSGLLDEDRKNIISYLHAAIKPANQLRMLEDSLVIYRLVRAPERRVFRIDVGGISTKNAEAYMEKIIAKYRNKIVYDANTGELQDARQNLAMIEDFWLPTRDGRGTEISTLNSGSSLGEIDDVIYFQKKLFRALKVPLNRLEQESSAFSLGRTNEISRDEIKFSKFISRLRAKFSDLFYQILKTKLLIKRIISTEQEWLDIKEGIFINYLKDNHFTELKESEIIRERLNTLREVNEYTGRYFSVEWVRKNILRQTDEDIKELDKEIEIEKEKYKEPDEEQSSGFGGRM
jgi:hypothetical protein